MKKLTEAERTRIMEMRLKEWEEMMKNYEEEKKEYARGAEIKVKEYVEKAKLSALQGSSDGSA